MLIIACPALLFCMTGLTGSGAWSVLSAADPAAAGQIPATPDQLTRPAPDHKLPGKCLIIRMYSLAPWQIS